MFADAIHEINITQCDDMRLVGRGGLGVRRCLGHCDKRDDGGEHVNCAPLE